MKLYATDVDHQNVVSQVLLDGVDVTNDCVEADVSGGLVGLLQRDEDDLIMHNGSGEPAIVMKMGIVTVRLATREADPPRAGTVTRSETTAGHTKAMPSRNLGWIMVER